jgi:hypothetical protein
LRIIAERYFNPTPDHDGRVPSLEYAGGTGKTIKQHLVEVVDTEQRGGSHRHTSAEKWLIEFPAGGPRKTNDVYAEGA